LENVFGIIVLGNPLFSGPLDGTHVQAPSHAAPAIAGAGTVGQGQAGGYACAPGSHCDGHGGLRGAGGEIHGEILAGKIGEVVLKAGGGGVEGVGG